MTRSTLIALVSLLVFPAAAAAHGPPAVSGGPTGVVNTTAANFVVTYDEDFTGQQYRLECKLDAEEWKPCTVAATPGSQTYENLADGVHSFQARRVSKLPMDPTDDQTPSEPWTWTVDTKAPETTLTVTPAGTAAKAEFTADEEGVSFECSIDGTAFAACTGPLELAGLAPGEHSVKVRGKDAAGNVEAAPAEQTWTVEPPAPVAPATPAQQPPAPLTAAPGALAPGATPTIIMGKAVKRPKACGKGKGRKGKRCVQRKKARARR